MRNDIGPQYSHDDHFKAAARLHQSTYRSQVLQVYYDEYGNRLTETDARALLNYYDGLNVRYELRNRYPSYSKKRDADMLRSEHMPFNLFAPLKLDAKTAQEVIEAAFGIQASSSIELRFEWAPEPKERYLGDGTAFDVYLEFRDDSSRVTGIGIEVKYTEQAYRIGTSEAQRVADPSSSYWSVTRKSGMFVDPANPLLGSDDMRQIWRNHLLGLSMVQNGDIDEFISITLYPESNEHFKRAIPEYQRMLKGCCQQQVRECTLEMFIAAIPSLDEEILRWKEWLRGRYLMDKNTV